MNRLYVKIDGIHCDHCIETITNKLLTKKNIKQVRIQKGIAEISYTGNLDKKWIVKTITSLDYYTKEEFISDNRYEIEKRISFSSFVLILFFLVLLFYLLQSIFGYNIFQVIPNIDSSITYGMLFITGILTSIHCVSMCGSLHLLAIMDPDKTDWKRPIFYHFGRVLSYSLLGGFAGLIGSVFTIHPIFHGLFLILVSLIMILIALRMLGFLDYRIPKLWKIRIKRKNHSSFVIGLLNGFMPCGPLQAMQVYALSTGNFFKGAYSMFLFGLGTVPLMLSIGLFYHYFSGKRKVLIHHIASVFLLLLSISMFQRGLLSLGVDFTKSFSDYDEYTKTSLVDSYQEVRISLDYNQYEDILVQKGIPVRMIIDADEKYLTGCNNEVVFKDFGIQKKLEVGENIIEFTPNKIGTYTYTCWMNMISNHIKVIDDKSYFEVRK